MKIELNLTSAFTLRKRIKELGRVNEQILAFSKYVVEPEQVDEELEKFENKNVYDTFMLCSKCGDEAYRLQNLIDEHNNKGKVVLNQLNAINKKIEIATRCANALKVNRTQKSRNPVTGNWEVTKLQKITDTDFETILDALTKEKVRAEDELSKINSKETFTFELDDEIYKKIYG
jgi:uncharacterized protein YpuA (DUF1002 family)